MPSARSDRPSSVRRGPRTRLGQVAAAIGAAGASLVLGAGPVLACGGLVGENGTVSLVRTTTLAAYHDGVERYVTSFEFTGEGEEVGSLVPLPDVPTEVERGGDWTLQRLQQEIADDEQFATTADAGAAESAEVLEEVEIDALDITILRGGADEVGRWATDNGFLLTPDSPEVLRFYAERSPIFMAARFDADRAAALGQQAGDGTPIMLTIPTDEPWVPLRILGLGLDADKTVGADVFLLTEDRPQLLAGGEGLGLDRSEAADRFLLTDLRTDEGMEWVPEDMWLTYMPLEVSAGDLDYDLAISTDADAAPDVDDAGIPTRQAVPVTSSDGGGFVWWPLAVGAIAATALVAGVALVRMMTAAPVRVTTGDHR